MKDYTTNKIENKKTNQKIIIKPTKITKKMARVLYKSLRRRKK